MLKLGLLSENVLDRPKWQGRVRGVFVIGSETLTPNYKEKWHLNACCCC